ncbi:Phosphatidylinositol-specific phospholipase C domain-containing protein [Mycena venus]|uniref:Phosphatidylinositol-specific phospholipase C domain-containing protein n=1 Tax=Mycena venus TaxID=2733690 RepID=A0A8H7CDF6_9AGAR|nr:Phosphatidylinositol-specific phospholipase C domain-containing protein [Mycena venus]
MDTQYFVDPLRTSGRSLRPSSIFGAVTVPPEVVQLHKGNDAYRSLSTASNPHWMQSIPDNTSLTSISIPENFGPSADTLTAQLNTGIRAFDIRLRINEGNTFTVHHGAIYQNANFDDVLNKWDVFLTAHPSEALLVRIRHECTGEGLSCSDDSGQKSFVDIFDQYRDSSPAAQRIWWRESTDRDNAAPVPTLGVVRGKAVLMVINEKFGGRAYEYGLAQFSEWNHGSSKFVQDSYTVPTIFNIPKKHDEVRSFLDSTNTGNQSAIYVNFCSGASAGAYPYTVAGGSPGIQGVNPFLLDYLNQGTEVHRTGVMFMDFPGGWAH